MGSRILLVAPSTGIVKVESEIQGILKSGLEVDPLIGYVNQRDLLNAVRSIKGTYEGFWFASHASEEGLQLSDGFLPSSLLVPILRGKFIWAFINSCSTLQTANLLQNELGITVICTLGPLLDTTAFQTGVLFAQHLVETGNTWEAYQQSKPGGNKDYLYLGTDSAKKNKTSEPVTGK